VPCGLCKGERELRLGDALVDCFWCDDGYRCGRRGIQRILSEPEKVIAEQDVLASGGYQ
jgi:hypothetical protein